VASFAEDWDSASLFIELVKYHAKLLCTRRSPVTDIIRLLREKTKMLYLS